MLDIQSLLNDNIGYLQQAANLLRGLHDEIYSNAVAVAFKSSVGAHLRHCLEHYESFIAGWRTGKIDYDARPRDAKVEHERTYALQRIETIIAALAELRPLEAQHSLQVKQASSAAAQSASPWCDSSIPRELQFLLSHTVHHYALIAMILRLQEFEPAATFGVAPSTLKYRRAGNS